MPPSGSKPSDGAVGIYGVHEFHDPPPRFELKWVALYPSLLQMAIVA
jgi:hypothetical protein